MEKKIKIDSLTSIIFALILLFYIAVTLANVPMLPVMGKYIFLLFMFLIFILLIQKKSITKRELLLFFPFIMFSLVYFINLNSKTDTNGIMIVVNQLAYMMVIYIIYSITWTKFQVKSLSYLHYIGIPMLFILIFIIPGVLNTNVIGSYAFYLSFFPLLYLVGYTKNLKKSRILLIFVLMLAVISATDTRSVLLSVAFGILTFFLWKFISSRKIFFNLYFFLIMAFNYFVIVVYPKMYTWDNFHTLNNLSLQITGKPLLTGRNTIWSQLVDLITIKPLLGYGSSVVPENFLSTSLSAHNLYLQIGLQTGLTGLILLLLFLFIIWESFWKNRYDPKVILVSSFFISILIHQTFEVTLTQNQFGIGLLQWMIIGFGLNYSLNKPKNIKTEP